MSSDEQPTRFPGARPELEDSRTTFSLSIRAQTALAAIARAQHTSEKTILDEFIADTEYASRDELDEVARDLSSKKLETSRHTRRIASKSLERVELLSRELGVTRDIAMEAVIIYNARRHAVGALTALRYIDQALQKIADEIWPQLEEVSHLATESGSEFLGLGWLEHDRGTFENRKRELTPVVDAAFESKEQMKAFLHKYVDDIKRFIGTTQSN